MIGKSYLIRGYRGMFLVTLIAFLMNACVTDTPSSDEKKDKEDVPKEVIIKLPNLLYGHYTGEISGENVSLDIQKEGDLFLGYLHKKGKKESHKVDGKINEKSIFFLVAKLDGKQAFRIEGKYIADNKIEATLKDDNGNVSDKFILTEDYTNAIAFDLSQKADTSYLFDNKDNASASLQVSVLSIKGNANEQIKKGINKAFFDKEETANVDNLINDYFTSYFAEYKKNENGLDSADIADMSFYWERINTMSVIYNDNGLLCVEIAFYDMSGGAHGNSAIAYHVYDVKQDKQLSKDDFFTENYSGRLTNILTEEVKRQVEDIEGTVVERLTDAGYFDDLISPNNNFYINEAGIGFYYNAYEIAPYVMGETDVHLKKSLIKNLLRKDCIINQF